VPILLAPLGSHRYVLKGFICDVVFCRRRRRWRRPRFLSLAPLVADGRLLELQGAGGPEAHRGGVGHAEGQARRGVDARAAEVEARRVAAPEACRADGERQTDTRHFK